MTEAAATIMLMAAIWAKTGSHMCADNKIVCGLLDIVSLALAIMGLLFLLELRLP